MISSSWEVPQIKAQDIPKPKKKKKKKKVLTFDHLALDNSSISDAQVYQDFTKALNDLMSKLQQSIADKQLSISDHLSKTVYDPNGPIPFPKTFDLDDKQTFDLDDKQNQQDPDKISKLLSEYGITCPGAESVEIVKDLNDPFLTTIVIKKTFF